MDKKRLKYYKDRLLKERAKLLGFACKNEDQGREADTEPSNDTADRASNSYTKELLFCQSTSERQTLILINEALNRIEDGTYGICLISGQQIAPERLEAIPWAKYTIEVQRKIECGELADEEQFES
jgi:RNA polymerase-binding transcription factor